MRSKTTTKRAARMTPLEAAARGAAAGFAATLLLSALARVLPGMDSQREDAKRGKAPAPPKNPFDPHQVQAWQARSQSPAAFAPQKAQSQPDPAPPGATPASALVQPQAPGPEGLAEQFAFKIASGVFDRDLAPYARPAGIAVHLTYGSFWGLLYGLIQASRRHPPLAFGTLYGLGVWLVGPGLLIPAMKLMHRPTEEPPVRTAMMIAGHAAYGAALAGAFDRIDP